MGGMPTIEERLHAHLLANYSAATRCEIHVGMIISSLNSLYPLNRPVYNPLDIVNVSMGLAVISLQKLDQRTSEAEFNVWLRHWWKDERLTWNPAGPILTHRLRVIMPNVAQTGEA